MGFLSGIFALFQRSTAGAVDLFFRPELTLSNADLLSVQKPLPRNCSIAQWLTGCGHINIGIQAFKENPLILRNFVVDLLNHPELLMGIFGHYTNNRSLQSNCEGALNQ